MAFTKIAAAGIGSTETVTVDGLDVINNGSFGGTLSVTGSVSVGGTLTYEDVTNVDSVGLITARNGIVVGSGITLSKDGNIFTTGISTFGGNIQLNVTNPEIEMNVGGPRFRVPAANTLTIHSGAGLGSADEERVRFTAGRVGINTTSPEYALDLRMDNDVASGVIQIIRNNTANGNGSFYCTDLAQVGNFSFGMPDNANAFVIVDGLGNSGSERLRINSTGSVGIGTDNPTSKLHLAGRLSVHHSAVDTEGEFLRIGRTDLPLIRYHSIKAKHGGAPVNNYISFLLHDTSDTTSQTEVFRLRSDGYVGIGTTVPNHKLHIQGDNPTLALESNSTTGNTNIVFGDGGGETQGKIQYHNNGDYMRFYTNGDNERIRITSGGSILMGGLTTQTSDTSKLAVQGGDSNIGIIQVHAGGGENVGDLSGITFSHGTDDATARAKCAIASRSTGDYGRGDLCFYVDGASDNLQVSAADEKLRIKGNGEVGIGTDDPDCKLHVMKGSAGTIDSDGNSVLTLENSNHCVLQMLSPADKSSYIMFGDPADANVGQIRYDQNINQLEFQTSAANVLSFNSNGYHRFWKHPVFISNLTGVYGTAGSLISSPASAKAQIASVADNNSNFDSTNHNFVCPVNGYYQTTVDVSLGNIGTEDIRRIFVMGYTLGGATGAQSNYVEVLDDKMSRYGNYNYSHPWFFTAGTTIAVGINGNSGTISTQKIQLSVFLITATSD
jgi:hypothetical protein